jgi:hypothetical protein
VLQQLNVVRLCKYSKKKNQNKNTDYPHYSTIFFVLLSGNKRNKNDFVFIKAIAGHRHFVPLRALIV